MSPEDQTTPTTPTTLALDERWPALDAGALAPETVPFPVVAPFRVRVDLARLGQSPFETSDASLIALDRRYPEYARAKLAAWSAVASPPVMARAPRREPEVDVRRHHRIQGHPGGARDGAARLGLTGAAGLT